MKQAIPYWQMGGFVFTAVVGTLLHFVFEWTGENVVAALFSAVNESIWEHLKLLFYPMVTVAIIQYFVWGKHTEAFWCIKLLGMLMGLVLIPVAYYTYTGISGVNADWLNITIFFLAAGIVYRTETNWFQRRDTCLIQPQFSIALFCIIGALFAVFTFMPPEIPLFQDPGKMMR